MPWTYKKKSMSEEFKDGFMKDMQCVVLLKDEYGFDRWSGGVVVVLIGGK